VVRVMSFEFKDAEVRKMKLEDLRPAEYNPRKIGKKAFRGLGKSIESFGFLVPIVWNQRSGNIVGGHQRYQLLMDEGEAEADVVVVDLDNDDEVALNIALNNPKMRGQFTEDAIGALKLAEARLGSTFKDLRLFDLHEAIVSQLREGKKNIQKSPSPPGGGAPPPPSPEPEAVVTCPQCNSKWRMKDKHILLDTTSEKPEDT